MGEDGEQPPGYPTQWEADVVLRDGTVASVRPIRPDDADGIHRFHAAQSDESIYLRFFAPLRRLSDADVHRFTHVDYVDRVALVATMRDEIIGIGRFDRVFVSYALSMIPGWERTVAAGLAALAPGGSLHVVDFGRQERLPAWSRRLLRAWLRKFHVGPRDSLREVLESESRRTGASLSFETLYRGYAVHAVLRSPPISAP